MQGIKLHGNGFSLKGLALLEKAVRISRGEQPTFSLSSYGSGPLLSDLATMASRSSAVRSYYIDKARKITPGRSSVS